MSDTELSDAGIAVMCDIARVSGLDLEPDKQVVLEGLIADGLVEACDTSTPISTSGCKFAVTPKGQRLLDERGVGVNES